MRSLTDLFRDIQSARKQMQAVADAAPRIIGVESVKAIKENFRLEGYDSGNAFTKWKDRKPSTNAQYDRGKKLNQKTGKLSRYRVGKNGTYKGSVFSSSKPILDQIGTLKNSIAYRANKRNVFIGVNNNLVPYAKAHNEGLNHQPKRQYMPLPGQPASPKIVTNVKRQLDYQTAKAMRLFKR